MSNLRKEADDFAIRVEAFKDESEKHFAKFGKIYGICKYGDSTYNLNDHYTQIYGVSLFSTSQYAIEVSKYRDSDFEWLTIPIEVLKADDPILAAWDFYRAESERVNTQRREQAFLQLQAQAHKLGYALLPVAKP